MKPQRVYEEMNKAFGRDTCYVSHHRPVADRRRAVPARLQAAPLDQLRPGRPAGLDHAGGARRARRRSRPQHRGAVGRLRFPVHDRGAGGRRAVQAALPPRRREQLLPRPDPPVAARLRDGLLRPARLRQHQRAGASAATASTTSRSSKAWAARRSASRAGRDPAGLRAGRALDEGVPGAGGGRDHPRARDQHLDGHRDRQDQRVRGAAPRTPGPTRRPPSRCSTDDRAEDIACPSSAANLTMLFTEHDFLDRFAAAPRATASQASSILFPYAFPKEQLADALRAERPDAGAAQPARRRLGRPASAASPACPTAVASSRTASARRSSTRRRSAARRSTAWRHHAREASTRSACAQTPSSTTCASRPSELEQAGIRLLIEPINTLRHPGFYLDRADQALRDPGRGRLATTCSCSTTSTTRSAWRRAARDATARIKDRDRPHPARRQPRPQRAGHAARSTIPSCSSRSTAMGYDGWIGCEYKPKAATTAGLGWTAAHTCARLSARTEQQGASAS